MLYVNGFSCVRWRITLHDFEFILHLLFSFLDQVRVLAVLSEEDKNDECQHNIEEKNLAHQPKIEHRDCIDAVGCLRLEIGNLSPRDHH